MENSSPHSLVTPKVKFHEGMPDVTKFDGRRSTFLVLDDLMSETNDDVANLFTKGSHHRKVSVMFLTQNLLYKNRHMRTISLNSHYMILFKNPRDARQFSIFVSADVSQQLEVCRRSVSRRHGETVWLSVCGLEPSAGRTIQT